MNKFVYKLFFGKGMGKHAKIKWIIMIMIQELSMGKWKSVLKYYFKKSYRKDINFVRDKLTLGVYTSQYKLVDLYAINFSHEINYPEWVDKLYLELLAGKDLPLIKVLYTREKGYIVIDGNHRLKAMLRRSSGQKRRFVVVRELFLKKDPNSFPVK